MIYCLAWLLSSTVYSHTAEHHANLSDFDFNGIGFIKLRAEIYKPTQKEIILIVNGISHGLGENVHSHSLAQVLAVGILKV